MPSTIDVIIADDHPLLREGIKKVITKEIDINVLGEAGNSSDLLTMLHNELPDILILDMSMPGKSGLDLIKEINTSYPRLPILILSMKPADEFAVRAIKAGAFGYLCKTSIAHELVRAIYKIIRQKRRYITDEVAEQMALHINHGNENDSPALHEELSDREFEVLCLIAEGYDISAIADKLNLSPHTVHTYRTRIKNKMNIHSNVEMARYAMENGLID